MAGLVIRHIRVVAQLVPKLLGNAALEGHGDGIAAGFLAQRHGVDHRSGKVHHLAGHRTHHRARRDGNGGGYRRHVRTGRQRYSDSTCALVDDAVHTQHGKGRDLRAGGRRYRIAAASTAAAGDQLTRLIQHGDGVGAGQYLFIACHDVLHRAGEVLRQTGGRRADQCLRPKRHIRGEGGA